MNKMVKSHWFVHDFYEYNILPDFFTPHPSLPDHIELINQSLEDDKIHLVRLIPPYLKSYLKLEKNFPGCDQVKGYCANLKEFASIDEYLKFQRGSKSRSKLRSYIRKLEKCFEIRYEMYYGDIKEQEYVKLMDKMEGFLLKRWDEKDETNQILHRFEEIKSIVLDQIKRKRASLFVIYNYNQPININLNFHFGKVMRNSIRSFDTDYSHFRLGQIELYKQLEWCFKNGYEIFDLGYGHLPYKSRWCNQEYKFENYFVFNEQNVWHRVKIPFLKAGFQIKHRYRGSILYAMERKIRSRIKRSPAQHRSQQSIIKHDLKQLPTNKILIPVSNLKQISSYFKPYIYEFQYRNSISNKELLVFKIDKEPNKLIIHNKETKMMELEHATNSH